MKKCTKIEKPKSLTTLTMHRPDEDQSTDRRGLGILRVSRVLFSTPFSFNSSGFF